MTNTTFTLLSTIGANAFLYFLFVLTPYFSTSDTYMGVFLEHNYRQTPEAKKILKSFLIYTTLTFLGTTLLLLGLFVLIPRLSQSPVLAVLLLVETFLYFMVYGRSYKQTIAYKQSLNLPTATGGKLLIDTAFIEQKNKIKLIYKKLLLVPVIIGLFLAVYTIYYYPAIKELIPTHFNALGEIDGWAPKSYLTALFPSGMLLLLTLIFSYSLDSTFNSRSKLSKAQLEAGKAIILKYLKLSAISILIIVLGVTVMMMSIAFATVQGSSLNPIYNLLAVGLIIFAIILMGYNNYRYKRELPPLQSTETYPTPEEQEANWVWGLFYNNPNDPAVLVAKRHGIGWTINIGSFKGKLILLVLFASIICSIIFATS